MDYFWKSLRNARLIVGGFGLLLLMSCAEPTSDGSKRPLLANQTNSSGTATTRTKRGGFFNRNERSNNVSRLGTDSFLNDQGLHQRKANNRLVATNTGKFKLSFVNMPLREAAKVVLGDALKRTYVVQDGVNASITIQTTREVDADTLYRIFTSVLETNGLSIKEDQGVYEIAAGDDSSRSLSLSPETLGPGQNSLAVPLKFISAAEMERIITPITEGAVAFQRIDKRNVIILSGSNDSIEAALEMVNIFDVDVFKGKSIAIVELKTTDPVSVVDELEQVFDNGPGGELEGVVRFIPSQRLSAVIVVSSRQRYLGEVRGWIRNLDREAGISNRYAEVYGLQNRNAADVLPILNGMIDPGGSTEDGTATNAPLRVAADTGRNAIVVWGNTAEQEELAKLVYSLDEAPVQVLLEATIAEVSLTDDLEFGLRWFFQNGSTKATYSDLSNGGVSPSFPGLSLLFQGGNSAVALNALSSITNVNVISSPNLVVVDNKEAKLQIGDEVPIATQQAVDTSNPNAPVVNTISFRDTGIILSVTPRVSSSGRVSLDIIQEVSAVARTTTSGIDSPTISQRRIETSVAVNDGQTIALGGLIQESRNKTRSQVPGLGNIPILGNAFRRRGVEAKKTELLILITPRVIKSDADARIVTDELRQRIQGADGLVRNGVKTSNPLHSVLK